MKKFLFVLLIISNIIIKSSADIDIDQYDDDEHDDKEYKYLNEDSNNINIVSISYELTYNDYSVVKVIIKTYNEIYNDIEFNAYLKSEEGNKKYLLNCSNTFYDSVECLSEKNITLNTDDKYYFYYEKGKNSNITIDERDNFEDVKRISLIFRPEIPNNLKLYKDKRSMDVKTNKETVNGGYLYILRKKKSVLHQPKDGFNKYIEFNNFISNARFDNFPPNTMIAYEEAIIRGYHIINADIYFSKDNIPVVCHEKNLENISEKEKGEISSKTLEELNQIDIGSKFGEKYKGEKIVVFEELLELCRDNDIIIDLNLGNLDFTKYFNDTDIYIKKIFDLVEEYDMFNSIYFNDNRTEVLLKLKTIKNDITLSISGINDKQKMDKIKELFKDSKRIIYNIEGSSTGGNTSTINEEIVQYGRSLEKKIKVGEVNDIIEAQKLQSWGVNYITTDNLHPFLIKNDIEEPIVVRCSHPEDDEEISECEIDEEIKLLDNEIYNIYYSENIYNVSEDISDTPIGQFLYVDTNILEELYYSIIAFNFEKGIIKLNVSDKLNKDEQIYGTVGPAYDNVAECYQFDFICEGNNSKTVDCQIQKDNTNKLEIKGNYAIYDLEGYSLNYEQVMKRMNVKKFYQKTSFFIIVGIFVFIIILVIICLIRIRKGDNFNEIRIADNSYISDNNLFR